MKDSIGGDAKTLMILNVSFSKDSLNETKRTLDQGKIAKTVEKKNDIEKLTNQVKEYERQLVKLEKENEDLKYKSNGKLHSTGQSSGSRGIKKYEFSRE